MEGEQGEVVAHSMFGPNSVPAGPVEGGRSVYGDTAILATTIDLGKEESMGAEQFKEQFLTGKEQRRGEEEEDPHRRKYLAWVRGEARKEGRAAKVVEKVEVGEVEVAEARPSKWRVEGGRQGSDSVRDYLKQFEEKTAAQTLVPQVQGEGRSEEVQGERRRVWKEEGLDGPRVVRVEGGGVAIPPDLLEQGFALFQLGRSFYDRQGQLLYSIPG